MTRPIIRGSHPCDLKYHSLFDYCLKELQYTEQQAWRRINAMRTVRELPEIKKSLTSGELSLSSINIASSLFNKASIERDTQIEIIQNLKNKTKAQCEDEIIKLKEKMGINSSGTKKTSLTKISSENLRLHLNLKKETYAKLERVKGLEREEDLDKILNMMCDLYIEHKTKAKRKTPLRPAKNSRFIPRQVKEAVYKRAQGKCENCGGTYALEFEHRIPFAKGGTNDLENIDFRCKCCNQRKAILDFGQEKMDYYLSGKGKSLSQIPNHSSA